MLIVCYLINIYIYIYIYRERERERERERDRERQRERERSAKYVSCKYFLSQCIKNKLVPKSLELALERKIGDFDQEFICKWYSSLKEFSSTLMSRAVRFCDKIIKETNDKIDQTDSILKTKLQKAEYEEIQKTIASNETATKKILH